jgi:hypothetical protein
MFLSFALFICVVLHVMVRLRKKLFNKIFKSKSTVNIKKTNKKNFDSFVSYLKVTSNNNSNGSHATTSDELTMNNFNSFTTNAFLDLETKVYGDNWSIPYKRKYD